MKHAPFPFMRMAVGCLLAFTLRSSPVPAQKPMTPEEEAIYRNMVKSSGGDPQTAADARKATDSSRRWTEGKDGIVDYHVVGVYQGRANVSGDASWIAWVDVTDRVVIDLRWKLAESKLVGTPVIQNGKSDVRNPRNPEPSCLPPVLKGEYEHYELQAVRQGLAGALELQVKTSYPAVDVVQSCTGTRKSIPASSKVRPEELSVPSPVMLGMALPDSDNLRASPDRKSLVVKKAGWTWTFTPTVKG